MNFSKKMSIKKLFILILILSIASSSILPTKATDDVGSLEKETTNLENELSALNQDLKQLDSEISSISNQIEDMNKRIEKIQSELSLAKGMEEVQYKKMKTRIRFMYEKGNRSLLESLFDSASLADFVKKADYFATINAYDRDSLKKLSDTQKTIMEKESQLAKEKEALNDILNDLDKKESELTSKIANKSSDLNKSKSKLDKIREDAEQTKNNLDKDVNPTTPPKDDTTNSRPQNNYVASASEIELFAALIECEAGSTNYEGMLAVASVIVNRMNHSAYPNTLRGVILQRGQFPPATNGKVDRILARGVKSSCLQVANDALAGKNNVGSCLSFRSASSGHAGTIIGGNVFF